MGIILARVQKKLPVFSKALVTMITHDGFEHAGNLSFLTLLAFLPFLLFFSSIAEYVNELIGYFDIKKYFIEALYSQFPEEIINIFSTQITAIASTRPSGLITLIIFSAVWISSSFVEGLRTALNKAYRVQNPPIYVLRRLLSIAQYIVLTCILVTTVLAFYTLSLLQQYSDVLAKIWPYFRYFIIPLMLLIGVSTIYLMIPDTKIKWTTTLPGAFIVVALWYLAAMLFMAYIRFFNQFNIIYGSIAGVIVFLMFCYLLNVCLIYGAELNANLNSLERN